MKIAFVGNSPCHFKLFTTLRRDLPSGGEPTPPLLLVSLEIVCLMSGTTRMEHRTWSWQFVFASLMASQGVAARPPQPTRPRGKADRKSASTRLPKGHGHSQAPRQMGVIQNRIKSSQTCIAVGIHCRGRGREEMPGKDGHLVSRPVVQCGQRQPCPDGAGNPMSVSAGSWSRGIRSFHPLLV